MYSSSPSIEHLFAQLLAPYSYYQLTACKLEILRTSGFHITTQSGNRKPETGNLKPEA